jgi:hypothetical protein
LAHGWCSAETRGVVLDSECGFGGREIYRELDHDLVPLPSRLRYLADFDILLLVTKGLLSIVKEFERER